MKSVLSAFSVFLVLVVALSSAHAVVINNTTTNTVLFDSNGFEHDTAGTPPVAQTGSWTTYYNDRVINDATPGAANGAKYLVTTRDVNGVGGPAAVWTGAPAAGEHVHIEYYAYYPSSADDNIVVGSNTILGRFETGATTGQFRSYDGAAYNVTGVTFTPNAWHKWEFDYTIGAANYDVSVDDGPTLSPAVWNPNAFSRIDWGHNGNDTYYLDGVPIPEPTSLALLACGAAALSRRRRR